jgi:serine/threonine protein kinase
MRICPRCQGRYDDESRFCPRDGAPLPAPEADPRLGSVLLGQFELLEVCGRGAMGTVYRAWQSGMDREVAVKLLRDDYVKDPAVVKRFHREARSVARLNHPNVVTVFLVGETDDHVPFMVMEYVDGEPLSSVLARGDALPVGRSLRIARQVASALAEAHSNGIVHRDLKPANILLEQRRRTADWVKVVDFGIAKVVGGEGGAAVSALTHTGTIFGTPHYLSPEQAQGAPLDGRADLYSLGVMLYAMVTGRVPYDGSGMAVVVQHVNGTPARPSSLVPGLPPPVEALILRLMEKDPAARPQTAEDVSDAIDGLLAQLGESGAPLARAESPALAAAKPTALPHALTVKASPLQHPLASAPPAVTIKGSPVKPPLQAVSTAALGSAPADATVPPPPSRVRVSAPEPRMSAETAFAMPPSSVMAAPMGSALVVPSPVAVKSSAPLPPSVQLSMEGGSDTWRPPSPWRRALLVFLALLFVGGAAAAGLYALKRSSARAAVVTPPASKPAPALAPDAGGAPVIVGQLPDGGLAPVPANEPLAPSPTQRVITLGEAGWSVRVLLPQTVVAASDVDFAVEAWDPAGKPSDAHELRLVIREPSGLERNLSMPAVEQLGRFQLRRRFPAPGHYHVHIYPAAGRNKPVVWFDLEVQDPDKIGVLTEPEPVRKAAALKVEHPKPQKKSGGTRASKDMKDLYQLLEPQNAPPKEEPPKTQEGPPPQEPPKPSKPSKNGPAQPGADVELE